MTELPRDWLTTLIGLLQREPAIVRIVVAEVRGSTPRDAGAFMLVGKEALMGTIGGGRLEWESIAAARELLADASVAARCNKSVLGADLGQCCGGVVSVWLERFTREDLDLLYAAADAALRGHAVLSTTVKGARVERQIIPASAHPGPSVNESSGELTFLERLDSEFPSVWLYGAGHVGQSLARILSELPLRLTWIDSRAELKSTPGVRYEPDPVASVSEAPVGAHFVVMTHSHPLDFRLCHEILQRNDFAWLGLIGSASKAARFRSRLRREGFDAATVASLVCPIGIEGIHSKWPAAIAVAVAAQILQRVSAPPDTHAEDSHDTLHLHAGPRAQPRAHVALHPQPGAHPHTRDDPHACSEENCAACGRTRTTVTT